MATANYLVGNVTSVSIGGASMYATKSDLTREVNVVKVTNSRGGGYQLVRPGNKKADCSVEVTYNGDDPPTITLGAEVAVVWATTGGLSHTLQMLITKITESFVIDGEFVLKADLTSSGSYT